MESLFNSPAMIKLQEFGQALGRNKFLSALQGAMMSLMSIIMVGAIFQIICAVGGPTMFNLFSSDSQTYQMLYAPYQFTMNLLSLWVVGIMAFNYARNLDVKSPVMSAIQCLSVFLLTCGALVTTEEAGTTISMTYLGAQGMFVGFFIVFVCVNIDRLCAEKNIYIHMPDIVPQAILNVVAVLVLAWLAMDVLHLITPQWIYLSALLPMGVANYLKTLDIRNSIFDYVMLIPTAAIWYPFFKTYEKQLVAQEQAAAEE